MLDMRSGRVGYAALVFGGSWDGREALCVPWDALVLDTKSKRFVLNVEKDRLEALLDSTRIMAQHGRPVLGEGIDSYYGTSRRRTARLREQPDEGQKRRVVKREDRS